MIVTVQKTKRFLIAALGQFGSLGTVISTETNIYGALLDFNDLSKWATHRHGDIVS